MYGTTDLMQCRNRAHVRVQSYVSASECTRKSEVVHRNRFISCEIASIYSSSKTKCFSIRKVIVKYSAFIKSGRGTYRISSSRSLQVKVRTTVYKVGAAYIRILMKHSQVFALTHMSAVTHTHECTMYLQV